MAKVSTARKAAAKPRKSATRKRPGAAARGGRIDLETLHKKLANPRTSEAELKKYFVIDEDRSGPFTPRLVLNDATVQVPPTPEGRARGEMAIASMNWWCRMRRTTLFNDQIAAGYKGPIIVSEGDSWFQFPIILDDVIDQLISKGYAVRSLDAAGDTLDNMIETGEYLDALTQTGASVFLFSAGGNDVLGGGNLVALLRDFDPTLTPAEHILPGFQKLLDAAIAGYDKVLRGVEALPGDILILCHGYDKPLPNKGKWLGKPMEKRGIKDKAFQSQIAGEMIDRFNAQLMQLVAGFPNARYLDLRGLVGTRPEPLVRRAASRSMPDSNRSATSSMRRSRRRSRALSAPGRTRWRVRRSNAGGGTPPPADPRRAAKAGKATKVGKASRRGSPSRPLAPCRPEQDRP